VPPIPSAPQKPSEEQGRRDADRVAEEGAITVADEHLATALTHRVMASVYGPSFGRATSRPGRILLAAVEGQRHSLGLRMAADVLELGGYEVNYLGAMCRSTH
jgi:methanogenic corrinoid protein MtbC1